MFSPSNPPTPYHKIEKVSSDDRIQTPPLEPKQALGLRFVLGFRALRERRNKNTWETHGFPNPSSTGNHRFPDPPPCSSPSIQIDTKITGFSPVIFDLARAKGLEPSTSRVTGGCSNQLSYARIAQRVAFYQKITNFRIPGVGGRFSVTTLCFARSRPRLAVAKRHAPAFDPSHKQSSLLVPPPRVSAGGIEPPTLGL